MALLLAACGDAAPSASTAPSASPDSSTSSTAAAPTAPTTTVESTTSASPTTTSSPPNVPEQIRGFELATVALDGRELLVAVADRSELRRQGLMNVADLGDLDGMVFVFEQDTTGGFWMKDTLLPLDIAFFTAEGVFVDGFPMEPCTTAECPTYRPSGAYRYALEVPQGRMPNEVELLVIRPEPTP